MLRRFGGRIGSSAWYRYCSFLASIDTEQLRARTANGSVVLLTHLPLHRPDDMLCGDERVRESGHVTYEHPSFRYEVHHHVLSQSLSALLLSTFAPDVVLSGHTHAWCEYNGHASGAREFTIPALSWGQRPDPSYALLGLRSRRSDEQLAGAQVEVISSSSGSGNKSRSGAHVARCSVPNEHGVFAMYIVTIAVLVLARLWRLWRLWRWCMGANRREAARAKTQ